MITDPEQRDRVLATFPFLQRASAALRDKFLASTSLARRPAGHLICQDGSQCGLRPLVVEGTGVSTSSARTAGR
jgi:CRP/FNR family transcriptional regulator, anaerobic regulatory protein